MGAVAREFRAASADARRRRVNSLVVLSQSPRRQTRSGVVSSQRGRWAGAWRDVLTNPRSLEPARARRMACRAGRPMPLAVSRPTCQRGTPPGVEMATQAGAISISVLISIFASLTI